LKAACRSTGFDAVATESHYESLKRFWAERFFSSDYCLEDIEVVGAPRFLSDCVKTGAKIVYCTGRHEAMRKGTESCLAKCGFPTVSTDGSVVLLMKPTQHESDDEYKRVAHQKIRSVGTLIAAFDNEPIHINDYAQAFPEAAAVHLATDHSGRLLQLHPRTVSIPHFAW
jgi:hypothetical protein